MKVNPPFRMTMLVLGGSLVLIGTIKSDWYAVVGGSAFLLSAAIWRGD